MATKKKGRGCHGNGSYKDAFEKDPALKARVRQELIVCPSTRHVAHKMGIPRNIVAKWRLEFLSDPEFTSAIEQYGNSLMEQALVAFENGLAAAEDVAAVSTNPLARAAAARVLTSAPADLARARNSLEVKLSGQVALDTIDELKQRLGESV
jgi:hypothetical protein